jgi:hypothetical protein
MNVDWDAHPRTPAAELAQSVLHTAPTWWGYGRHTSPDFLCRLEATSNDCGDDRFIER